MISGFSSIKQVSVPWTLMFAVGMGQMADGTAEEIGEPLFKSACGVCHTIGAGRLVGPDLSGVLHRRSEEWLHKFIKSSQTVINSGDTDAIALFNEYSKISMPDAPITDHQIGEVLSYIKAVSLSAGGSNVEVP